MPNDFYQDSGNPANNSQGDSSVIRAEFASIEAAFDKLPTLTGNGDKTCVINAGGTAITVKTSAEMRALLDLEVGTDIQAFDATLLSLAALGTAADKMAYTTGVDTWAETALTAAGRAILDDADNTAQRATLGLVIGTDVPALGSTVMDGDAAGGHLAGTFPNPTIVSPLNAAVAVLLANMLRTSASGSNAGPITLPAAPNTAITSVSLGSLTAGDVILFEAQVTFTKGGTAGGNVIYLTKTAGTGSISFLLGGNPTLGSYCQASLGETWRWFGFAVVTVTGTVTLGLEGTSAGSDSSIGIGGADIGAYVLKNG